MKRIITALAIGVLLITSFSHCKKNTPEVSDQSEFETYLQDEAEEQKAPAMAVVIFKEDQVLNESYVGHSSLETMEELTSNDLFLLASISKVVTATALLQLHDAGHFALDDPISDHLPFLVMSPHDSTDITFRMLLTHTSSIADGSALDDQYYYNEDSPVALEDFLRAYLVHGGDHYSASENYHDFEPGNEHEYSNTGSALIAVLVEHIANQPFNAYCKKHIFDPLGMNDTYWSLEEAMQSGKVLVQPYEYSRGDYDKVEHYTFTDYPNGGLRSSARDLARLMGVLAAGGSYDGHQLLKPSTVSAMQTPQIYNIDDEVGLHLFIMDRDLGLWGHDGGEKGVATMAAFHPDTKVGVVILCNEGEAQLEEALKVAYEYGVEL